ncbi:MAG TPA: hypothetical protein VGS19_27320 [Streptosporangiaceae bacterium]|nr:hypothetical protein [Streptosporangiaceae bacterium]
MGYQDVTLYKLVFEGRDGLEVTAEGLNTGDLFDLMELAGSLPDDVTKVKLDAETRNAVMKLMTTLADALDSWNVEDRKGQPVPATLDGLKTQNLGLVMDIIGAWIGAQTGVSDDLGKDSSSGPTSALERSLPMAPPSPNPGS